MAKKLILILGGARSGKSKLAKEMAEKLGKKVLFVATGQPLDDEMALRITEHKRNRPENWQTLEIDIKVGQKLEEQVGGAEVVLLDCVTLLVSNILTREGREPFSSPSTGEDEGEGENCERSEGISGVEKRVIDEIEELIECIDTHESTFIVVSNEVGLDLVPENRLGRVYRDLLGKANQLLARHADVVYLMASGISLKIKG